jgi:hypothetical protein
MTWLSFILTNRNAYIQCMGEELCLNPANWQWGTGVNIGHCLEVMHCWYESYRMVGFFCFSFTGQWTCFVTLEICYNKFISIVAKLMGGRNRAHHYTLSLLWIKQLIVKSINWWSKINTFTIKVNHCGLLYGAWAMCFPIKVTFETEWDLSQLSYLFLPIHTSADAVQAGGPVTTGRPNEQEV